MNLYQIDIYPNDPLYVAIQFRVNAATKEGAEIIAKKIITDLGLPAYPETMFERSLLKTFKMEKRSGIFGYGPEDIDAFKVRWPCHGFPDNLNCVIAYFERNGDLCDLDAFDPSGDNIEIESFNGSSLAALVSDIQDFGYVALPGFAEDYRE